MFEKFKLVLQTFNIKLVPTTCPYLVNINSNNIETIPNNQKARVWLHFPGYTLPDFNPGYTLK